MRVYTNQDATIISAYGNERSVNIGRNYTLEQVAAAIDAGTWRGAVPHRHSRKLYPLTRSGFRCACGRCFAYRRLRTKL